MLKFILKTGFFLLPIILLHFYSYLFYNTKGGDLLRVGYVHDGSPKSKLITDKSVQTTLKFSKATNSNLNDNYNVLTIGDSFSELDSLGYQNYLAQNKDLNILHIDQGIHNNEPIQALSNFLNSDFFDTVKVKFVIVESVERYFSGRCLNVDTIKKMTYKNIQAIIEKPNKGQNSESDYKFFSNRVLKFAKSNLLYLFDDNAYESEVYQTKLDGNYFTNNKKNLLFIYDDLDAVPINNKKYNSEISNAFLNSIDKKLKARGILLIVLVAADKYDFYYDYIIDKNKYTKPIFFENMSKVRKNYLFVDSKKILSDSINTRKDIYQYGDTHWSPQSSRIIANALYKIISSQQEKLPIKN